MLDDLKRYRSMMSERAILLEILAGLDDRAARAKKITGKKIPGQAELRALYKTKITDIDRRVEAVKDRLATCPVTVSEALHARYIQGKDIETIAGEMCYSVRSVNRILRDAEKIYSK